MFPFSNCSASAGLKQHQDKLSLRVGELKHCLAEKPIATSCPPKEFPPLQLRVPSQGLFLCFVYLPFDTYPALRISTEINASSCANSGLKEQVKCQCPSHPETISVWCSRERVSTGESCLKSSNTGHLVLKALIQVNNFGRVKEVLGSHRTRDDFSIMARRLAMGSGSEP